jgi:signal transduction histidine kinase
MLADPRQWEAALHPADRERARALPPSLVGDDAEREYRIVRPDGTVRWIIDRAFPIRDAGGRIYRRAAIARDVTAIHDAAETTALRDLAAKIEAAREEERQHVAREIHDVLAQVLTGLKLHLASLSPCIGDPAQERLQASTAAVDAAIGVVRRLATSLRPVLLDDLGLVEALRSHARQFSARTEIGCELDLPAIAPACGAERATALFRIFDEALSNVARHAGARQVWVHLTVRDGDMTLRVDDDGRGFAAGELSASRALGLLAMRERARVFGGTVEVTGAPGRGTSVVARLRLDVH